MKRQTVCSRDAYEKGWLAARQSRSGNVDVSEARFLRRYGHHKVDAWFAGWRDRTAGVAKWTSLDAHGRVSHTDVPLQDGEEQPPTPPRKRTMPNKRAKDTQIRSVAMPDSLWNRAARVAAKTGASTGAVIRDALDKHVPEDVDTTDREHQPA